MNWRKSIKYKDLLSEYNSNADDELEEIKRVIPMWIERIESNSSISHFSETLKKVKVTTYNLHKDNTSLFSSVRNKEGELKTQAR